MNAHVPITRSVQVEMSEDGSVLVPEQIRKAAGLIPGTTLMAGINGRGEVVLMTKTQFKRLGESPDEREARIREAIDSLRGTIDTGFATTDEYMDFVRPHRLDDR